MDLMMDSAGWDGTPNAPDPPFGATVVIYRHTESQVEFLILHRAHSGPEYEGDWAWTPPAGARRPGEDIDACAERELHEEAGLLSKPIRTDFGSRNWVVYSARVDLNTEVVLHDSEHDRFEWVSLQEARQRCSPEVVFEAIESVAQSTSA